MREFYYECFECGELFQPVGHMIECSECGGLLQYFYPGVKVRRFSDLVLPFMKGVWVFQKVLPIRWVHTNAVSLGEGGTPLGLSKPVINFAGLDNVAVYLKNEMLNPTGTFKDRGSTVSLSVFKERNISEISLASLGDTSISYAVYNKDAGRRIVVFSPLQQPIADGGENMVTVSVRGGLHDAEAIAKDFADKTGFVFDGGFKNPNMTAGLETLAYEMVVQLYQKYGKRLNEMVEKGKVWYVHPTSSGSTLIAWYQALDRMNEWGLLKGFIRLVCVQPEGCPSIVDPALKKLKKLEAPIKSETWVKELEVEWPKESYPYVRYVVSESDGLFCKVKEKSVRGVYCLSEELFDVQVSASTAVSLAAIAELSSNFERGDLVIVSLTCGEQTQEISKGRAVGPVSTTTSIEELVEKHLNL
ncbi:MAG: threonine synthase [Candidatus Freyarchaeota archaeon]